jgi:serine/threonine protein kinase
MFIFVLLDILKSPLNSGGGGIIYTGIDKSNGELYALKFIHIGGKDSEEREKSMKELNSEFRVGMALSQDCEFLIHYKEILKFKDFQVIVMEYCNGGDLQQQLDKKKIFEEDVLNNQINLFLFPI